MRLQQFIINFFLFRFITFISFIFLLPQCHYQASHLFLDPQPPSPKETPTITDRDYEKNMTKAVWNDPDIHDNIIVSSNDTYADSASSGRGFHDGRDLAIIPANVLDSARRRNLQPNDEYKDLQTTHGTRFRAGIACKPLYECPEGWTWFQSLDDCVVVKVCPPIEQCYGQAHPNTPTMLLDHCYCRSGYWRGPSSSTCEDIDECTHMANNKCKIYGEKCVNTVGSYRCDCNDGFIRRWAGISCQDKNECESDNKCKETFDSEKLTFNITSVKEVGGCENTVGSYKCVCNNGFVLDSDEKTCKDIDECALNITPCDQIILEERQNGISKFSVQEEGCVNIHGSYTCTCSPGFEHQNENTTICHEINECLKTPAVCNAQTSTCVNTRGDYYCDCLWGYKHKGSNNKICVDIDECTEGVQGDKMNPACNPETSKCNNKIGTFDCVCYDGYKHTGKKSGSCFDCCQDIDECSMSKEEGKWLCEDLCKDGLAKPPQNYTCGCNPKRFLDGVRCFEEKCILSPWGQWTNCNVISGLGKQVRNRVILSKGDFCGNVALKMEQACFVEDTYQSRSQKTNWTQIAIAGGCLMAVLVGVNICCCAYRRRQKNRVAHFYGFFYE